MKPEHKPAIRSAVAASYFVQFTAEQVRGILLDVACQACGIPDGADVKIHTTDIDPINFSLSHDLVFPSRESENCAKEPHTGPLEVLGYVGPEKVESAISRRDGEADGAKSAQCEPGSRAAEIMAAAADLEASAAELEASAAELLAEEVEEAQLSLVQSHVRGLPVDSLWGLEDDIELLERSIEGQNHHQIGDAMGWSETGMLRRFSVLVGRKFKEPAKFGREEVLAALRELSGTAKQEASE